jgi:hypothetical protein
MATMTLDELVTQLRAAYGPRLSCILLYGSAASGEHVPNKSDYNIVVLLDHIEADTLRAASAVAQAWREAGNPPPMTMTVQEWRTSSDVFPMEYSDILERHRILFGESPLQGLQISRENLRLQLESQAMGKLLQLRQGALLAGTDGKRQLELLDASFSTIMVLFRAASRLAGAPPADDNVALVEQVAKLGGIEPDAFVRIARHRRGEDRIRPEDAGELLFRYLTGVERLNAYLDTFTI